MQKLEENIYPFDSTELFFYYFMKYILPESMPYIPYMGTFLLHRNHVVKSWTHGAYC
jgi:hypothetical protein